MIKKIKEIIVVLPSGQEFSMQRKNETAADEDVNETVIAIRKFFGSVDEVQCQLTDGGYLVLWGDTLKNSYVRVICE